jgi:hypothetical protein
MSQVLVGSISDEMYDEVDTIAIDVCFVGLFTLSTTTTSGKALFWPINILCFECCLLDTFRSSVFVWRLVGT